MWDNDLSICPTFVPRIAMSHTDETRKHNGRIRELFPTFTIIIAIVALLFIGSAIVAIVASGITHFHEAAHLG